MNKVYIVILNYKTWEDTIECLESVFKLNYHEYKVIIVDNASGNNSLFHIMQWLEGSSQYNIKPSAELQNYVLPFELKPISYRTISENDIYTLTDLSEKVVLIQSNFNNGFAAGNNIGIKFIMQQNDYSYIWLLNNDTVVRPESLSKLVECHKVENNNAIIKTGIAGSLLLFYHHPSRVQGIGGKFSKFSGHFYELGKNMNVQKIGNLNNKIDYAIGASMLVSKEFLEKTGLMHEDYFLYFEEIDWSIRGLKHGFRTISCTSSIVYHKEGGTTGKNLKTEMLKYRNLLLFYDRFYRSIKFVAYYRLTIKFGKKLLLGKLNEAKSILMVISGYDKK